MSEYQYYEFLAMDRPLNDSELADLRSLSTRAHITPTSLVNEYHWSDFRGDAAALMKHCFDAHFYFANWGTVGEIIDAADALRHRRIRAEQRQQAKAERLRAEQAAAKRRKRLEWLARNEESSWQKVETLIDTKKPAEYDNAVDLLVDLRAVNEQQEKMAEFSRRFTEIRDRHHRKVSLLDRLTRGGLG